ncbi:MAG: Type secretion protein [Verrucomicrobiales bacterium]|nr:Type secretion protein [Verrucomicrobiales bacterium]
MSEGAGDKSEKPTAKHLQEAIEQGNFPRSAEVQTVAVLFAGMSALSFTGGEMWRQMLESFFKIFSHLHEIPISENVMQGYCITSSMVLGKCLWPILSATAIAGLLAGGMQCRFRASPEALGFKFERLNPLEGLARVFSFKSAVPTALSILKLGFIATLSQKVVQEIVSDPIFYTSVDVARIAEFLSTSTFKIVHRIGGSLLIVAAADYGYQWFKVGKNLMMTKAEVKEESKNSDGNPEVKNAQRRRRSARSKKKMLAEVAQADVVLVNPTHIAVALRYDRKTMKAPKIVAKGSRLNALRIREIATQNQIPIIENKPLARMMFKYGKVGGEIPAQLFTAVAEILAYVYRVNAYRYYTQNNRN